MKAIEKHQFRAIYGISKNIGVDNENLHLLVEGCTGQSSIKALSFDEAENVIQELKERQKLSGTPPAKPKQKKPRPETPGGVTNQQQSKVWALMYELEKFDPARNGANVGTRLCGIIKKQFNVDAPPAQPFRFLKMQQGRELIETLKNMAEQAELKAIHNGGVKYG